MDVYCPKCGEPCDSYEFHDAAIATRSTYEAVAAAFRRNGCAALDWTCRPNADAHRADMAAAVYDLLEEDMDGAASILDNADRLRIL